MAKAVKASDKQTICRKLITALKKRYSGTSSKENRPVLETMLFACCLEDADYQPAVGAYENLLSSFHDLNEIRVSSISEIEHALKGIERPEWRALRIRSCLQYVFEKKYEFEFEGIKRKTLDLASKNLARIPNISPFVQSYTLYRSLGGHIVPLDTCMTNAVIWLGFVDPKMDVKKAIEAMKPALKKPDVEIFCHLVRQLSLDPKLRAVFDGAVEMAPEDGNDLRQAPTRLNELFKSPAKFKPRKKSTTRKSAARTTKSKKVVKKVKSGITTAKKKKTAPRPTAKKVAKKAVRKGVKKTAKKVLKKKPVKKKKK